MSVYQKYTDQELTSRLAGLDGHAFAELYKRYKPGISQFILKFVHAEQMAEDLTQEVFVKIWESAAQLNEVRSIKAYLLTTAKNHTLNCLQKTLRSEVALGVVVSRFVEERNLLEEDILSKEYSEFLARALAKLPQRSREIFKLCREQEKTYEQAAEILGISRNAIKNHMVSTMKILSNSVKRDLGISLPVFLAILMK